MPTQNPSSSVVRPDIPPALSSNDHDLLAGLSNSWLSSSPLKAALARLVWHEKRPTTENIYVHEGQQWRSYTGSEIVGLSGKLMTAEQRIERLSAELRVAKGCENAALERTAAWALQVDTTKAEATVKENELRVQASQLHYALQMAESQRDAARINQKHAESREQAANERFIAVSRQLAAANARPAAPNWLGYRDETVTIDRDDAGDRHVCLAREEWLRRADQCPVLEARVEELTRQLKVANGFDTTWVTTTEKLAHLAPDGQALTVYDPINPKTGVTLSCSDWLRVFYEHARMKAALLSLSNFVPTPSVK